MPEIEIQISDVFQLYKRDRKTLCQVRGCQRHRKKGRYRICATHYQSLWRRRNPLRSAFRALRDHAVGRKIPFALSFDDFKAFAELTGYVEGKGNSASSLSIDRINAGRGYVLDNIQIMTIADNSSKSSLDRKYVFREGVRIPWEEIDLSAYKQAEDERRKSFVPFYQNQNPPAEEPSDEWDDEPAWLR